MRSKEKTANCVRKLFRIADTMLFSFLLMLLILPYMRFATHKWILIPVFLLITVIVCLFRTRYRSISIRKKSYQNKEQQQIEHILLQSDEALSERFGKQRFILIRKECPDRFDVMEAIRKQADAIGLFSDDPALMQPIMSYSPQTAVYLRKELICAYSGDVSEAYAAKDRFRIIASLKYNRYLILGILFLAASFLLRLKIYYRVISSVCLIIAAVSGIFGNRKRRNNLPIFLDKKDD